MALSAMVRRLLGNALVSTSGAKELADAVDLSTTKVATAPTLGGANTWTGFNQFNGNFALNCPDHATVGFYAINTASVMQFAGAIDFFNVSYLGPGGGHISLGQDPTDLVGFNGAAPTAQRAGAAQAVVPAGAATNVSPYGFTQAQANALLTLVNEIRAALVEKGIIKGSA